LGAAARLRSPPHSLSNMSAPVPPPSGTLLARLGTCRGRALASGALQPIDTCCEVVEDGDLSFAVRVLSPVARKAEARHRERQALGTPDCNPFLPYDEELYVGDAGAGHVCLLNKFNVIDDHLLVVTREFEAQESLLSPADFGAVWSLLWEAEGLVFYNSGAAAGASQPHKHLQLVLGPLCPCGPEIPIAAACEAAARAGHNALPELPVAHAFRALPSGRDAAAAADRSARTYADLLAALNLTAGSGAPAPYNLLFTRTWMLVVPRSRECFRNISVNALGFAGALLVRDAEELALLTSHRPLQVLRHVALPRPV